MRVMRILFTTKIKKYSATKEAIENDTKKSIHPKISRFYPPTPYPEYTRSHA